MNFKSLRELFTAPVKITDDATQSVSILQSLLAEEYLAWYSYLSVSNFISGSERPSVEKFFIETAKDELDDHAFKLLKRIEELGGKPLRFQEWTVVARSIPEQSDDLSVVAQLEVNKKAEQDAIEHYSTAIQFFEEIQDTTTVELLKEIKADEEEHLTEIDNFLTDILQKH